MNKQTLKTTIMVKKEVEEPIEVQLCPICGSVPKVQYYASPVNGKPYTMVKCHNCNICADIKYWNKLSYEERDNEKSDVFPDENDVFINSSVRHFLARYGIQGENSDERLKFMEKNGYVAVWEKTNIGGTYKYVLYKDNEKIAELDYIKEK